MLRGGLDLGGTKIQAAVVDADGRVLGAARRPTPSADGPGSIVAALAESLREAAAAAGVGLRALAGAGIGTPGSVDGERGTVSGARNLSGFEGDIALAALLQDELGLAVRIGNDVGVALEAEARFGAAADVRTFAGLWWGTGVGGGIVVDRRRWLGRGRAGEIGHTVVVIGGRTCPCGRRGCVEAYAGRRAMEERARRLIERGTRSRLPAIARKKGLERWTSGVWARALRDEDPLAGKLVDRAVLALAACAASVVNLLDVEAIVIGGGLGTRLGEPYARRIAEAMVPHLFLPDRAPPVRVSALGDLGGAIGAALL